MAHQQLDAAAYGWADYTLAMPDEEIFEALAGVEPGAVQFSIRKV